ASSTSSLPNPATVTVSPPSHLMCLDSCCVAQRCAPSEKNPGDTPNECEEQNIVEEIPSDAPGENRERLWTVADSFGRHEHNRARPDEEQPCASNMEDAQPQKLHDKQRDHKTAHSAA